MNAFVFEIRKFINWVILNDLILYQTTKETMAYNSSGVARSLVPEGWEFYGWGSGKRRYCSFDALPFMKKGWFVDINDTIEANPTEPIPGDIEIIEIHFIHRDGTKDEYNVTGKK